MLSKEDEDFIHDLREYSLPDWLLWTFVVLLLVPLVISIGAIVEALR